MARNGKTLVFAGAAGATLLLAGFLAFAAAAARPAGPPPVSADGIVVLTGAERRIDAGLGLLRGGVGKRLLISGINARTMPEDVLRHARTGLAETPCCIDFGYEAQDTIGNAIETRAWADRHGFTRLVVVTSSYHMPRSLNELALALPGVELIPYRVMPRALAEGTWWVRPSAARVLASEYIKLLPSYARYAAHRLLGPNDPPDATSRPPTPRAAAL